MKIGIIVHSKTGTTYNVALKLKERLSKEGHSVEIEKLIPAGDAYPGVKNLKLKNYPKTDNYNALIFGAPVWAFSLSPVMAAYLKDISSLQNKKIACFTTMSFPFPWMGGKHTIKQMKKACEIKNGIVNETGIITGNKSQKDKMINSLSEKFVKIF